jgi:nitrite reductase/ring-hydroxylating ferredoxin subunit
VAWLSEHLTDLFEQGDDTVETVARSLAIERAHLTAITVGSRTPNENLIRRLASHFQEDADLWVLETFGGPVVVAAPLKTVESAFMRVGKLPDIPEGEMLIVFDDAVAIANVGGELFAFDNVCPHAGASLGDGVLDDFLVECPFHAGRWDVRTGKATNVLAPQDVDVYEIRVVGDDIELKR